MMSLMAIVLVALVVVSAATEHDNNLFSSWFVDQRAEIIDSLTSLEVEGTLPSYLKGGLYRVGPSIIHPGKRNFTNYLDAFGRITQWRLNGNKNSASFNSAMIKSKVLNESLASASDANLQSDEFDIARHITLQKTMPKTNPGIFDTEAMDNTDVNVYKWKTGANKDSIISMTDFYIMNKIDSTTLRSEGGLHSKEDDDNNDKDWPKNAEWSGSHPVEWIHPNTGEIYLANWLGKKDASLKGCTIYGYIMDNANRRHIIGQTSIDFVPYSIHSIAVANNLLSIYVGSVHLEFLETGLDLCISCSIKNKMKSKSAEIFVFDILKGFTNSKMSVSGMDRGVDRDGGRSDAAYAGPIASVKVDPKKYTPTFLFHHFNARSYDYTDTDTVSGDGDGGTGTVHPRLDLDVCAYNTMEGVLGAHVLGDLSDVQDINIRESLPTGCDSLRRLSIDLDTSQLISMIDLTVRDDEGTVYRTELASVNPTYWGKEACFTYSMVYHYGGEKRYEDIGIVKTDICAAATGGDDVTTIVASYHEQDIYPGEPIFVPNPAADSDAEDDGCVLVVSLNAKVRKTQLLIFDAKNMEKVATVTAPFPLMFEFHGQFFSDEEEEQEYQ